MSGGAYDYFCHKVQYSSVTERQIEILNEMIEFISEEQKKIEDSQAIINYLKKKVLILQTLWTPGDFELLHDIEWAASGDYSPKQIETMEYYLSKG